MIAELIGAGELTPELLQRAAVVLNGQLSSGDVTIKTCTFAGADPRKLRAALEKSLARCPLVLVVGGLGPGADGIARGTLAEFLGRSLVYHKDSLERIRAAYGRAGRPMPKAVEKLAALPDQAVVFPGQKGITPGCAVTLGQKHVILLPGAEKEYLPMARACVRPYLDKFSGGGSDNTRVINVFGLSEARVRSLVASKYAVLRNPSVAIHCKDGEVQVAVTTRAASKTEASILSAPVIKELLGVFGEHAYGVDQVSLQNVVIGSLQANRMTIAAGESGTQGLLTDLLGEADASGKVFLLGVQADTDHAKRGQLDISEKFLRKYDAVSAQTAAAMAKGAREAGSADLGVAVTGAGKTESWFVAICDKSSVWTAEMGIPDGAEPSYLRRMAVMMALDLARRVVAALPRRYPGAAPLGIIESGKLPKTPVTDIPAPGGTQTKNKKKPKKTPQKKGGGFFAAIFPVRGDPFGEILRKLVLLLAICTFVGSAGYLGVYYYQAFSNKALSEEMAGQYEAGVISGGKLEIPDNYPKEYQRKFANLYAINQDVGGWLKIPDTQVNYPVVYYEPDNLYYSRRDFTGKSNRHGVPWIEARCTLEPQCDNYIIYGHNMADGQMFGELIKYKPSDGGLAFLQAHPIISMDDVYRDNDYKIISVFISNTNPKYGDVFYYNYFTDLSDERNFNAFVDEVTQRSYYISNVDVQPGDKFITLSTCSYEYGPVSDNADVRTVVVGRRLRKGEKTDGSDILYQVNPSPKMPQGFTKEIAAGAHAGTAAQYIQAKSGNSARQAVAEQDAPLTASDAQAAPVMAMTTDPVAVQTAALESSRAAAQETSMREAAQAASQEAARAASEAAARQAFEAAQEASRAEQARQELEAAALAAAESSRAAAQAASSQAAAQAAAEAARAASEKEASERERMAALEAAASREAALEAEASRQEARMLSESAREEDEEENEEEEDEDETQDDERRPALAGDTLTISSGGKVSGTADEIIPKVVMNEMGNGFSTEALKAQAVAAYTYIKYQNDHGDIPALGMRAPSAEVKKACDAVLGEAVYSGSSLAFTPFFATSAGVTVASEDVWGGSYSYLVSVDSEVDERAGGYEKSVSYTAEEVARKVEKAMDVDLFDYSSDPDDWFEIESYTDGERYVKKLRVGDKTTTGRAFREKVMNLRSAAFEIDYDGSRFTFTTWGYGHGVGMSQTGANFYAQDGWNYVDILEHYYPGTRVR